MKINEFIKNFGTEEIKISSNFASKGIGSNYNIVDTVTEFCDNAIDARFDKMFINFVITIDTNNHTLSFFDDGKGVSDAENLFKLGGTDKEKRNDSIGKYGVGVEGACSCIASKCINDKEDLVVVTFSSSCNGVHFEKSTAFDCNGNQTIGETKYFECEPNEHFTNIVFTNVTIDQKDCSSFVNHLEEIFEEPLQKYLNIRMINNGNERVLGKSKQSTFVGDEINETVIVANHSIDIKYRIIGGSDNRSFRETGIRFYDKKSGRLLALSTNYWRWFSSREAQQNICGLRIGVYIDSSLECYRLFGISSTKNGIVYREYYKDPIFAQLKEKLSSIYARACNTKSHQPEDEILLSGYTFNFTSSKKMTSIYEVIETTGVVLVKKHPSNVDYAKLIADNIRLQKMCEKKKQLKNKIKISQ